MSDIRSMVASAASTVGQVPGYATSATAGPVTPAEIKQALQALQTMLSQVKSDPSALKDKLAADPAAFKDMYTADPSASKGMYTADPSAFKDMYTADPSAFKEMYTADPSASKEMYTADPAASKDMYTADPSAAKLPADTPKTTGEMANYLFGADGKSGLTAQDANLTNGVHKDDNYMNGLPTWKADLTTKKASFDAIIADPSTPDDVRKSAQACSNQIGTTLQHIADFQNPPATTDTPPATTNTPPAPAPAPGPANDLSSSGVANVGTSNAMVNAKLTDGAALQMGVGNGVRTTLDQGGGSQPLEADAFDPKAASDPNKHADDYIRQGGKIIAQTAYVLDGDSAGKARPTVDQVNQTVKAITDATGANPQDVREMLAAQYVSHNQNAVNSGALLPQTIADAFQISPADAQSMCTADKAYVAKNVSDLGSDVKLSAVDDKTLTTIKNQLESAINGSNEDGQFGDDVGKLKDSLNQVINGNYTDGMKQKATDALKIITDVASGSGSGTPSHDQQTQMRDALKQLGVATA